MGLIDPELDELEMTLNDIKYLDDPIIQITIKKIKLVCFKFAINNKLDSDKFKNEISLLISGFAREKRAYLENYANVLTNRMQNVINPPEVNYNLDGTWHWGDEIAPQR